MRDLILIDAEKMSGEICINVFSGEISYLQKTSQIIKNVKLFYPLCFSNSTRLGRALSVVYLRDALLYITYECLEKRFGFYIANSVNILTYRDNQCYADYIVQLKRDSIAALVKLAELQYLIDNHEESVKNMSATQRVIKLEKHQLAKHILHDYLTRGI